MHGCSWKEGRAGLLKSSALGKRERRGWVDGKEGWRVLSSGRRCHSLLQIQTNPQLLPLALLLIHPTCPLWTSYSPSTMTNSRCHTPQLDPCLESLRVCVCVWERVMTGGREGRVVWLGACVMVFATCCHTITWELCVHVCVCVWAKGACSWGTHPVRMQCYYLSSGRYESQGIVSGKRERQKQEQKTNGGVFWGGE